MNFFTWIREGVRQAVVLGVSDAVDQIGTPEQAPDMQKHLQGLVQEGEVLTVKGNSKTGTRRKRLGRSLSESGASGS